MIDPMSAARRLVRSRLAAFVVCAGGALLALPAVGLAAAPWDSTIEPVTASGGATQLSTGLDQAQNLTAVWNDGSGIDASVRSATTATWQATPDALSTSGSDPDVAVASDGTAVATWADGGNIWVETRTGGTWGGLTEISSTGTASSPQAAIVGTTQSVYWIDGSSIESASAPAAIWGTPAPVATLGSDTISDLRVAISSAGTGAASWLRYDGTDVNVDSAAISGATWAVAGTPLSTTAATATSQVSVATNGTLSAIAWNDSTGLHAAIANGGGFTTESNADEAGATQPAAAIDSNGQVFVASIASGGVATEIRTGANTWTSPATLSSASLPAGPSASADASGDVVVAWATSGPLQLDAYDKNPPTVSINAPASPASPGLHHWSVSTFDVWSGAASTTSWTFDDTNTTLSGAGVDYSSNIPGPLTVHATETDGAGNSTDATPATITISSIAPTNNTAAAITNGSAPVDGTTLGVNPGNWSGNPTPVLSYAWQRCAASAICTSVASGTSYTLGAADVGSRIRVVETATNDGGNPSVPSTETPVVGPIVASGLAPSLAFSGTLADGTTLTATAPASLFDGATGITLSYVFQHCNGGSCSPVQSGSSNTYTLGVGDVGLKLEVVVTATAGPVDGSSATATATSSQTGVAAPRSTAVPTLTGNAKDRSALSAASPPSSWDGATGLTTSFTFMRCDASGNGCSDVATNSSGSYTLTGADLGSTIRVRATASKGGSTAIDSGQSIATAPIAPTASTTPTTPTGVTQDGQVLDASSVVSWFDAGSVTISYQWVQCMLGTCNNVASQGNSQTYTLQPADVGAKIQVVVSATAGTARTSVTSTQTAAVQPLNNGVASITPPTVQQDGQTFSASNGSWNGATGLAFAYQWLRCNTAGGGCSTISGATNGSYTAGAPDVGQTLEVTVSASKNGSAVTSSGNSSQTAVIAPLATGLPTLVGAAQDTASITASSLAAMWDGVTVTPSFQFYRCNTSGGSCSPISGATGTSYKLTLADIGSKIEVIASASKGGSAVIASSPSALTAVIAPFLITPPAQPGGTPQDTQVLTASNGSWADQGGLSFSYEWFHCSPTCSSVGDPSGTNTYTLKPTDVGDTIKVAVTAFVGTGAATSTSVATVAVAPINTGVSTITVPTQIQDGQGFTSSDGAWDGAAGLTFSYQWKRCAADGTGCTAIAGATSKSYTATAADVASTLKALVSATAGSSATTPATGDSTQTAVIAPRNTVLPATSGTPMDGQTLSTAASAASSWDNPAAPLSFTYQWMRCDTGGSNCVAITGATATSYVLTADDVATVGGATPARHTVRVRVTAQTANGASTFSDSPATSQIAARTTTLTTLPAVVGTPVAGQLLSATSGAWTGTGMQTVSFQWIRCDASTFSSCVNLGTASPLSTTYTVQPADVGHVVSFIQTAENILGAVVTQQAPFTVTTLSNTLEPTAEPIVTAANYVDGTTLSTDNGEWLPTDSLVFGYKWLRCPNDIDTSTCPAIGGATSSTYTLTPADIGAYVVSQVRADYMQNGQSQANYSQPSDLDGLSAVTALPPGNTAKPVITGSAQQGATLTVSQGAWSGTNTTDVPITYTYQWFRCNAGGSGCAAIAGATKATYTSTVTDVGSTLEARVIASNSGGSQLIFTAATATVIGLPAASTGGGGDPGTTGGGTTTTPDTGTPGGGGHTGTAAGGGDKTAPRLVLAFGSGGKLAGGTTLTVDATCPKTEQTCTSRFQLLAVLKKRTGNAVAKPVTVASTSAIVTGGQKKVLKLKLSLAARTVLKRSHSLKATLSVSVTDAAGNVTPKQTKGITLRWK
jgi:Ig domain of plant-specific actin-binding protein